MSRSLALLATAALGAGLGSVSGYTVAAFSATAANEGNSFEAAASFCASPVTETVTASADSYVDGALLSAGTNFGAATTVRVRSDALGNQRALVRFSLPVVPASCTLSQAKLRLHASSASGGRTLEAFRAAGGWTETGVTWNNQPAIAGPAATASASTGWVELDVTAQVAAMYDGTNHGFLVRDASEGGVLAKAQAFSSREGANAPELVVTFS